MILDLSSNKTDAAMPPGHLPDGGHDKKQNGERVISENRVTQEHVGNVGPQLAS